MSTLQVNGLRFQSYDKKTLHKAQFKRKIKFQMNQ